MEIEQDIRVGAFHQIPAISMLNIQSETISFKGECASPNFSNKPLQVFITLTNFYVIDQNQENTSTKRCFTTELNFDLKFQILYSQKENTCSKKLGIRIFKSYDEYNDFFADTYQTNAIKDVLTKRINQRGFHYHFKPIRKLGKGNFASVYQVSRLCDGNRFAVKAFSKINTFSSQNGKEGLINQLAVLRKLQHENILSLQSVFQSDNSIYVILELLSKKSLYDQIKQKKGDFKTEEIQEIMWGLFKGLKQMGRKRIIHRDLKPQNIMLRQEKQYNPVIIDFGLSTPCDLEKYLFYRCGTPGFVAPQVIKTHQNMKTQPPCDIFSIGCIFHILLTGYPIFPGTQYSQVYQKNKLLQFNIRTQKITQKSSYALNLLEQMLKEDPLERIKPEKALNHPFFGGFKQQNQDLQTASSLTRNGTLSSES